MSEIMGDISSVLMFDALEGEMFGLELLAEVLC